MKTKEKNTQQETVDIKDEFCMAQDKEDLTSDEVFNFQQRINSQRCSPLGECNDGKSGITEEVEKEALDGVKKENAEHNKK